MPCESLAVVGSANVDLVSYVATLPRPGETVQALRTERRPGGKGANQAAAAARLGVPTSLVASVGDDEWGRELLDALATAGVGTEHVTVSPLPTGTACIAVDDAGEDTIVVDPGANLDVSLERVDLERFAAVLCQLEIPLEVVETAAARATGLFALNASPMRALPASLWARCDLVVVNETEYEGAGRALGASRRLVVTLGPRGAVLYEGGEERARADSPDVDVVDRVGAGDAFAAAFVAGTMQGRDPDEALARACRAGACTVSRRGTIGAFPSDGELGP